MNHSHQAVLDSQAIFTINSIERIYSAIFSNNNHHSLARTMRTKHYKLIFSIFTLLLASSAIAQEQSLQELQQRCEQAREAKIAPLRQEAIDECITSNTRRRDVNEYCERFYSDFGQGGRTQSGHFRQPMFNDLPECQKFHEAERQSRDSGRSR